jgi:FkbM family methyltransferase
VSEAPQDYRESDLGRRRSWYGVKRYVKRVLSWRIPHALLRALVRMLPSLARTGRLPAPASVREVEGVVRGTPFVMLRPDRCIVAKELYWGRGRRPRAEDAFALELFAELSSRSDVALDVGAYTGIFSVAAAAVNPFADVHAFEIVPDVYRLLLENCVRNDLLDRVTLHLEGVGEQGARMLVPATSSGSALPDFYSDRLRFDTGVHVRFVSLDSLLPLIPPEATVLAKVDVEGSENEVLRGGDAFLRGFAPDVLCEVLAGVADGGELEALLAPHGYRLFLVRETDLLEMDRLVPSQRFRDWLFTTRDASELRAMGISVVSGASSGPDSVPTPAARTQTGRSPP